MGGRDFVAVTRVLFAGAVAVTEDLSVVEVKLFHHLRLSDMGNEKCADVNSTEGSEGSWYVCGREMVH